MTELRDCAEATGSPSRASRVRAHHGVFDSSARDGQEFVIDVSVAVDLARRARRGDDLADTVHYGELAEAVVAAVERDPSTSSRPSPSGSPPSRSASRPSTRSRSPCTSREAPITVPFADVAVTIVRSRA